MVNFTAFYYARSFASFTKPYPIVYNRAPKYLRTFQQGYLVSTPFILNYLTRKYQFSNVLDLAQPLASVQLIASAYRAIPKPFRRVLLPVVFFNAQPIALHYYPDSRLVFYKAFFFKRFFFAFFTYRVFQMYGIISAGVVFQTNRTWSHLTN